jgi:drug/metabolite transporter (DMT)-like permease
VSTDPRTTGRLQLIAAALLFSTGGAAIKFISFTGWQVAGLRSGVAALTVWLLVPASRRGWTWRTFAAGVAYASTLILFVLANKLTTSANTIFLQSTAPLYLLLIGPWLLHERGTAEDLAVMALVAMGLALFFLGREQAVATAPNPPFGNALAAASGLTWAFTIVSLRWLGARDASPGAAVSAVVAGNTIAFLTCLPFALPLTRGTPADWTVIAYLGVFQIGAAYMLVTTGLRRVPALEASVLLLVEPALNPVWAWMVHGERPGTLAIVGGVVIVSTTTAKAVYDNRRGDRRTAGGEGETGEVGGAG